MLSYLSYLLALRLSSYIQARLNDRRRRRRRAIKHVSARPISKPVSSFTACRTRRLNKKKMNVTWSKYYQQRTFVCDGVFLYSTRRVVLANKRNQAEKNKRNQAENNHFNHKIAARIISSTISSKIAEIRKKRMDHLCNFLRFEVAARNIRSTISSKVAEIRKKRMDHLCNFLRFKIAAKQIRSTIASKAAETRKKRMQHICSDLRFKIAAKHIRATIASKATVTTTSKVMNSTTSNLKRVQFAQDNQVHEIMHFSEYTAQERGGSWYSQQDFRRMRRDREDENWENMIAQMKKRKVDAIAVFQDDRGAFKKRKVQTADADEEVMAVCLPPPCPVWFDTHPASAAAQSSQEVIVPDDSSEPGHVLEKPVGRAIDLFSPRAEDDVPQSVPCHIYVDRFTVVAMMITPAIASKSAIQIQVQDFANDDSLTYSVDESDVDDNDSLLGMSSDDDDDIEMGEDKVVVVEAAADEEQEDEVQEEEVQEQEEKCKRASSPVRRSERIRHRGLGSTFTGSGRRYSKRLAGKK